MTNSFLTGFGVPTTIMTPRDDIIRSLFEPALSSVNEYRRAVGFFSSAWISRNATGLSRLAASGGVAKWVTSPHLSQDDLEALLSSPDEAKSTVERSLLASVDELALSLSHDTLNTVAWMVADGLLQFRIAVPASSSKGNDFHSKFGIFLVDDEPIAAFIGSLNESIRALDNHEVVSVFHRSRPTEKNRILELNHLFEELWLNKDPAYRVVSLPVAVRERMIKLRQPKRPYDPPQMKRHGYFSQLRVYQNAAVQAWVDNGHKGILEMATGTGKTITALATIEHLLACPSPPKVILVACPYKHLVDQWVEQLHSFGLPIVSAHDSRASWASKLSDAVLSLDVGASKALIVATTYSTLTSDALANALRRLWTTTYLVADECHYLGARATQAGMRAEIPYRLGLSATPSRHYDLGGTKAINSYFSGTVFEYGLASAIAEGHLTPYYYYPELIELSEREAETYAALTARLARLMQGRQEPSEAAFRVAVQRARVLNNATAKIDWLKSKLAEKAPADWNYTLVYAGDRIFSAVTELVGRDLGIRCHEFTSRQSRRERASILERFDSKDLQVLVAMKCLDEGVDVPPTRQAFFLASSGNPREFVQRRGRILRRSPGKDAATIVDSIALPSPELLSSSTDPAWKAVRAALKGQLSRITEFAGLSLNPSEADDLVFDLRLKFDLPLTDRIEEHHAF